MKHIDSLSFQEVAKISDDDARKVLEGLRWPDGPVCPRCEGKGVKAVKGGRKGLYRCADCRKAKRADQFTVTVGTVFEDSHIGLSKWLQAFAMVCASKKGVSALQLQRQLGLGSYRSAWHMAHRIRHVLSPTDPFTPLCGDIEVDETYVGGKPRIKKGEGYKTRSQRKTPVVAMIQRDGIMRAVAMQKVGGRNLRRVLKENACSEHSRLLTDESPLYTKIGRTFCRGHGTVNHSQYEYSRGDVYTNTAESWFALLKRGVMGAFHHVSRAHLGRYVDEFEFRWNNRKVTDGIRTINALKQTEGRRLMYRDLAGRMSA